MKMLYVGPRMIVAKLLAVSKRDFPYLQADAIRYDRYADTTALLQAYNKKVDAILFTGRTPFALYEGVRTENLPCAYLPAHETTLYRVLLEITHLHKRNIEHLSVDTYDPQMMQRLYGEMGVAFDPGRIFFAQRNDLQPSYLDYVLEFHRHNCTAHGVSCCITGLEEVYHALRRERLPVVLTMPAEDVTAQGIQNLQLRCIAQQNSENQIVLLAIQLQLPTAYSLLHEEEYAYLCQRLRILDKLYLFNSRIDGVLVEQGPNAFMIFTTRKSVERETRGTRIFTCCRCFAKPAWCASAWALATEGRPMHPSSTRMRASSARNGMRAAERTSSLRTTK